MTFRYDPATKRAKVTIYAGRDMNGRQRQRSKTWTAPNERRARREAAGHEKKLRDEIDAVHERRGTVAGLVDEWQAIRDAKDSESTKRKRAAMLRRIRTDLGAIPLGELSAQHVDRWLVELAQRGMSDTTVANHWSCLRAILRQGEDWDRVSARAAMRARPPRRMSNRRPTPPTGSAVALLVDTAPGDLRVAATLAAYAGLRAGEVIALPWYDVDFDGHRIHVRRAAVSLKTDGDRRAPRMGYKAPKSGQPRTVDVDEDVIAVLRAHWEALQATAVQLRVEPPAVSDPIMWDVARERPRNLSWLSQAWAKHARRQGAPGVRFHDLRHSYATEAIDAGVPIPVVQELLGHLQLSTTQNIYAHAVESGGQQAARVLGERRRALQGGTG